MGRRPKRRSRRRCGCRASSVYLTTCGVTQSPSDAVASLSHSVHCPSLQTDDEEAAQDEEQEALRLQREQQAALRPEDYDDAHLFPDAERGAASSSEDDSSDEDEELALGDAAAAQVQAVSARAHLLESLDEKYTMIAAAEGAARVEATALVHDAVKLQPAGFRQCARQSSTGQC